MSKIHLQLSGGLGNQLFQFAFAKNLSIKLNRQLLIETKSGLNDRYLRKQELPESLINNYKNNSFIVYFIFKIEKFLKLFLKKKIISSRPWGIIYDDRYKIKFDKKFLSHINNQKNIYIMGYYQSPKYFMDNSIEIKRSIVNSIKINFRYKKLFNIAKTKNSVAIGVRLYEEIAKNKLSTVGKIEKLKFYNESIKKIYNKIKRPVFFIFCSHNSKFLKKLIFNKKTDVRFVLPETGINEIRSTLYLFANCKNHIISNSSFYWWGYFLSNRNFSIISKEFMNKDCTKHQRNLDSRSKTL
jgi:hypothetical protein